MQIHALIGDVGGTNCRLSLISLNSTDAKNTSDTVVLERRYESNRFTSLDNVMKLFLSDHNLTTSSPMYPQICVLCVAGPCDKVTRTMENGVVEHGTLSKSTALSWDICSFSIANVLQLHSSQVRIMNDFEGVGYGILALQPDHYTTLSGSESLIPSPTGPIGVLGPGTGLGQAFLTYNFTTQEYDVNSSEGGHTTYAPQSALEFGLVEYIQAQFGPHVSFERVCSGRGIRSIYSFFKHRKDPKNPLYLPENHHIYLDEHKPSPDVEPILGAKHPAQAIFESAQQGDELCGDVVNLFLRALGNAAGNLGISILSYGGIYIAGGMGSKIQWAFDPSNSEKYPASTIDTSSFMASYLNKGRLKPYLEKIPIKLVLVDEVGLMGCSVIAKRIAFRDLHSKL